VCEGRTQCIPKPTPGNYSKYKNKEEYTHTIILNIKKIKKKHIQKKWERNNMKKNHINFAHPDKWSDSLTSPVESPSVTISVATLWKHARTWKRWLKHKFLKL